MNRASGARIVGGLCVAALLALGLMLAFLPGGSDTGPRSALSTQGDGRRGLLLLCQELGFEAAVWSAAPGDLAPPPATLLLPRIPQGPAWTRPESGAPPSDRAVEHYVNFVEQGGVLVLRLDVETEAFLREELGLSALADLEIERGELGGESERLRLASGEELAVAWKSYAWFADVPDGSGLEVVAAFQDGGALVLSCELGRGRLLVLAGDEFLENRLIGAADHGLLAVRLLESVHRGGPLLFDEYALGSWDPPSALALAFRSRVLAFTLHLLALSALLLWMACAPRAFPRDPTERSGLSARARASAFASLLEREGRWHLLARMLQAGVLRRVGRMAGLHASRAELAVDAAKSGPQLASARIVVDGVRGRVLHRDEALAALTATGIGDRAAFEDLARKLARLEGAAVHGPSALQKIRRTT